MRWQINQFIFCDQQQTLTVDERSIQLEPMMVELLRYFCLNLDQIISKDQLIEQVWLGRIVSDNAVSKLITKLRKALSDDVRQPQFIATFPKKGYKFIANVNPIVEQSLSHTDVDALSDKHNEAEALAFKSSLFGANYARYLLFILVILVLLTSGLIWQQLSQTHGVTSSYAKVLTTDAGDEFFPAVSPDGTRLAYMLNKDNRMHLMIKDLNDERVVEIKHQQGLGVGPASWSDDGTQLVYLVASKQQCQYFIRSVNGLQFSEPRLIHNCPAGSYGKIAFTHDNNRLIYSESAGFNSPYELFELELSTGKKKRLPQPELFLGGNSQFDIHPSDNKLLISSPDKQQWEGFYSLDLSTGQLSLLFKLDAYICCGIWSHDGKRVVLMGEHPAYQLVSYDLTGKDKRVIYSGSREISRPRRHTNGKDYLFSSETDNSNVHLLHLATQQQSVVADASVDERLATLAHHSQQIAYVSLATGNEEIWLTDSQVNSRTKLTDFNDNRHYIDLLWSRNNAYLLALTLNEMHLIDVATGEFARLKLPQSEIIGVSFKDEATISYSIKQENQWRVYAYDLATDSVTPEDTKWQFIQYHPNSENILWLDQANRLFVGASQNLLTNENIPVEALLNGRQFNLKKRQQSWFWFARNENSKIHRYDQQDDQVTTLVETEVAHFDIVENQLLFGHIEKINANIYQTQAVIE